jgi:hypothetical protein
MFRLEMNDCLISKSHILGLQSKKNIINLDYVPKKT